MSNNPVARPASPLQRRSGSPIFADVLGRFSPSRFRLRKNASDPTRSTTVELIKAASRFNGGGSGDILRVSHPSAGELALKRLHMPGNDTQVDKIRKYAFEEAEIWKTLQHPNVLPFIELLEHDGSLYLISPYISNGSLSDYLRGHPDADRPRLILEVAAAVTFLHSRQLIHGDIKAANILVSHDIHALLCDFGLTRSANIVTTTSQKGKGSVPWESPEFMHGGGRTYASDIWAFGMTIYEVLSGNTPYHELKGSTAVIQAVCFRDERPPQIPTHSPANLSYEPVWHVASDCWKKNPDERQSMKRAHVALEHACGLLTPITIEDIKTATWFNGGGSGAIFVLPHPSAGKLALKRLHMPGNDKQIEKIRKYAFEEAEIWKTLQHANVLRFIQLLELDGYLYLISPYASNGSLSDYLRGHPDADRPRLILELAAAIVFLHSREFIHGDIKAANVLVSDDIHALLCDFGLTRSANIMTTAGQKGNGTLRWESPEFMENGGGRTYASDVWAFGMTIYEVLSGNIPYHELNANTAVIRAVCDLDKRPPEIPTHSPANLSYAPVWRVASDCWRKNPDERSSMKDAHSGLEAATRSLSHEHSNVQAPGYLHEPYPSSSAPSSQPPMLGEKLHDTDVNDVALLVSHETTVQTQIDRVSSPVQDDSDAINPVNGHENPTEGWVQDSKSLSDPEGKVWGDGTSMEGGTPATTFRDDASSEFWVGKPPQYHHGRDPSSARHEQPRQDSSEPTQPLSPSRPSQPLLPLYRSANGLTLIHAEFESFPSPSSSFFSQQPNFPNKQPKMDLSPQVARHRGTPQIVATGDFAGGTRSEISLAHGHNGRGGGWVKGGRRLSDPHGNRGDVKSQYDGMPTSSSSPTFRGNKHLSTGPPITTPTSAAYNLSTGSSRPPSGPSAQKRLSLGIVAKLPNDKRIPLTSSRIAPASPTPSHAQSNRASRNYFPATPLAPLPLQVPATSHPDSDTIVLKIMDFGFQKGDKRRRLLKKIDLKNPPSPPPQAPGGFLGPLEPDEIARLKMDGQAGSESGFTKDDSSDDDPYDKDEGAGYYTAMYDFDGEGSAEMNLKAGEEIRCLGRGGGEGWMVAVRPGRYEVLHALVPEGYLEFLRPLTSKERKQAMARFTS